MAERIRVWFATNRRQARGNQKGWYGETFHTDGPEFYRVGSARVVHEGETYRVDGVDTFDERRPDASGLDSRAKLGSTRLFSELKTEMAKGRDLIVLIHGYASAFTDALERAAELSHKYTVTRKDGEVHNPLVLVFSWPSNGEMVPFKSYVSDRTDAAKSGHAMARLFFRLDDFFKREFEKQRTASTREAREAHKPCRRPIHLVAHSMGNWALRAGLQHVVERLGGAGLPNLFDNVFLMAADEDKDALESPNKLGPLPAMANAVHVYHSKDDTALVISDVTKLNPDRLGHSGPARIAETPENVFAVDCRHVDRTTLFDADHQYYRLVPEVIRDVKQVLAGKTPVLIDGRQMLDHPRRWLIEPLAGIGSNEPFART